MNSPTGTTLAKRVPPPSPPPAAQPPPVDLVRPSESGAAVAPVGAVTSLAALMTGHVLRDGEIVLLVLKPSFWFIVFHSLRFAAAALLVVLLVAALPQPLPHRMVHLWVEAAIFVIAGRVMWAVCQWMGRLYLLTDQRIVRIAGVFNVDVFDCALRKVARTQRVCSLKDRACRVGSIEIHPRDEAVPIGVWQTIPRPREVHEIVVAAINRAGPCGGTE